MLKAWRILVLARDIRMVLANSGEKFPIREPAIEG